MLIVSARILFRLQISIPGVLYREVQIPVLTNIHRNGNTSALRTDTKSKKKSFTKLVHIYITTNFHLLGYELENYQK